MIGLVKDINPGSLSWIHISETEGLYFQGSPNLQNLKENLVLVYCGLREKFSKVQYIIHFIFFSILSTHPDIAYAAMSLGQYNTSPTRAHLIIAKGVLQYLAGTKDLHLVFITLNQSPLLSSHTQVLVDYQMQTRLQTRETEKASQATASTTAIV